MAQVVKRSRRYRSPKRAEQAHQTRRDILSAARELFVERGYPATTIGAVADAAGVAIQTVYAAVGNKRALLWAVLETAVAGDAAPRTLLERFRDTLDPAAGPRDRLLLAVRFGRQTIERSADVHRIMRSATSDPEIAAAFAQAERLRYRDAAAFVVVIAGDEGFSENMTARTAADMYFALVGYEVHDLLTRARGWSSARYETWIARSLEPIFR